MSQHPSWQRPSDSSPRGTTNILVTAPKLMFELTPTLCFYGWFSPNCANWWGCSHPRQASGSISPGTGGYPQRRQRQSAIFSHWCASTWCTKGMYSWTLHFRPFFKLGRTLLLSYATYDELLWLYWIPLFTQNITLFKLNFISCPVLSAQTFTVDLWEAEQSTYAGSWSSSSAVPTALLE